MFKKVKSKFCKAPKILTNKQICCVCGSSEGCIVGSGFDFEYLSCSNEWKVVCCKECSHIYLKDRPSRDSLQTVYPDNYGNYGNIRDKSLPFRVKAAMEAFAFSNILPKNIDSVYDVGCGNGRLLKIIRRIRPSIQSLAGCEISSAASGSSIGSAFDIQEGDFDQIVLNRAYQAFFMIQVIEHVPDPRKTLQKIFDNLEPLGLLVIETPSYECMDFQIFKRQCWGGYHFPRHFNIFRKDGLVRILSDIGFDVIKTDVLLQPVHWVWSIHHLLMSMGIPSWLYSSFSISNPFWIFVFTLVDAFQVFLLGKSSNIRYVCAKR